MALFSGSGKKYSISYITCFNEGSAHEIKKILSDLDCKSFPEYLDKIIEAKASEATGKNILIFIYKFLFNLIRAFLIFFYIFNFFIYISFIIFLLIKSIIYILIFRG